MLKKLVLSLASLLVALLAAELLIRVAGAAPEVSVIRKGRFQLSRNPKIGYEPVPDLRYEGEDLSFFDYQGASNSAGFRDVEHAVAKPSGVYRVVVLGDSIAAGLRVERYEDTFPAILEKLLRERGLNAEVINLAVSGYNTQQEVELFKEKGLRYRPDLVLVAYSLTDRERVDGDILKTLPAFSTSAAGAPWRGHCSSSRRSSWSAQVCPSGTPQPKVSESPRATTLRSPGLRCARVTSSGRRNPWLSVRTRAPISQASAFGWCSSTTPGSEDSVFTCRA